MGLWGWGLLSVATRVTRDLKHTSTPSHTHTITFLKNTLRCQEHRVRRLEVQLVTVPVALYCGYIYVYVIDVWACKYVYMSICGWL